MIKILRCTKVEILGSKDGKEEVIATVSKKDGQLTVKSNDNEFKRGLLEKLTTSLTDEEKRKLIRLTEPRIIKEELGKRVKNWRNGFPLYWSREKNGWHEDLVIIQEPQDPFFLEALVGPEKLVSRDEKLCGYTNIWAREAGKVWEEEVHEEMLQ